MDQPDREVEPQFTHPIRQIVLMLIVLGLTGFGAFVALPRVLPVFQANPYLNGFIIFVFVIGVLACFWQVLQLIGSVRWIEDFAADRPGHDHIKAPRLLAALATLLRQRDRRLQIASSSARSILDSVAERIDEAREITRYIVNMLIFLGLLGTFYGLATTVPAVVDTIRSLAPQEGEGGVQVFNRLMTGLEAQLGGMGVAFASSLLGLAGSLVVGLLELFASHGQNRFYRELEEWMSTITRVGFASGDGEGGTDNDAMASVLVQLSEQMENMQIIMAQSAGSYDSVGQLNEHLANLQATMEKSIQSQSAIGEVANQLDGMQAALVTAENNRAALDQKLVALAQSIDWIANLVGESNSGAQTNEILSRIADGQDRLSETLSSARPDDPSGDGIDAESRMRLRSLDVQVLRILEEISAGRQETMAEIRTDLAAMSKIFAKALAARQTPTGTARPASRVLPLTDPEP